jgi:BolA family transcriptional regulator, general stress-responsive regulator
METIDKIYISLQKFFLTQDIRVVDISSQYKRLPDAQCLDKGHYRVFVASDRFKKLSLVDQHRLVYKALKDMLDHEIQALSIKTMTREEYISGEIRF